MTCILQVGVGSGGMPVLDAVARDARITRAVILDPDVFQEHNVERHLFGRSAIGQLKVDLALEWLADLRTDLEIIALPWNLDDPAHASDIESFARQCDLGICAADNEAAKFRFDHIMRSAGKPWTLGEVLSGGIGGLVHRFVPDGPCYGCVASFLMRDVTEAPPTPAPDYSAPGGPAPETRVPAAKSAIAAIAGLHANLTIDMLDGTDPGFTTLLLSLKRVEGVFAEAYRPHKFKVPRSPECLMCAATAVGAVAGEDLDVAVEQALARLGGA